MSIRPPQGPFSVTRRVVGEDALATLVAKLARESAWFEVTPEPCDVYLVQVKPDRESLLPPLKNWKTATDAEVLTLARRELGEDPGDNDEMFVDDWSQVAVRDEHGAWVTGKLYVSFPTDQA